MLILLLGVLEASSSSEGILTGHEVKRKALPSNPPEPHLGFTCCTSTGHGDSPTRCNSGARPPSLALPRCSASRCKVACAGFCRARHQQKRDFGKTLSAVSRILHKVRFILFRCRQFAMNATSVPHVTMLHDRILCDNPSMMHQVQPPLSRFQ